MKVLILVMSADFEPYVSLTNSIKETWASYKLEDIDILFYYSRSDKVNTNDDIFFNVDEGSQNLGYKTIDIFEYIQNFDFEYIFRTNSSSYINQSMLLEFLKDKSSTKFYCGIHNNYVIPSGFASGCGYFLSKDLVKLITENKNMWNHNFLDDVALGDLLSKLNILIDSRATRFDIFKEDGTYILPDDINSYYHFRCKYPQKQAWITDLDRSNDIMIMKKLYEMEKIKKIKWKKY